SVDRHFLLTWTKCTASVHISVELISRTMVTHIHIIFHLCHLGFRLHHHVRRVHHRHVRIFPGFHRHRRPHGFRNFPPPPLLRWRLPLPALLVLPLRANHRWRSSGGNWQAR